MTAPVSHMAPHNLRRILAERAELEADAQAMFDLLVFLTGLNEGNFPELLHTAGKALGGRAQEAAEYFRNKRWEHQ